jgi:4-methyl-5(b-hydroxyethyl)-thiazole monophosphate biosynthesis
MVPARPDWNSFIPWNSSVSSEAMRTGILVYDTCAQFEVVFAALILKDKGDVTTYGLEMRDYESMEGFRIRPHRLVEDLRPGDLDLFIIPGGRPETIAGNALLSRKLAELNSEGKMLAAICGGPVHLGNAGLLRGKRFTTSVYEEWHDAFEGGTYVDEDLVEDGNIITAWPNAYADFALTLGRRMGAFTDKAEEASTLRMIREFQRE